MNTTKADAEPLVQWQEPAAFLGLKETAFWNAVKNYGIPKYTINRRVVRFRMSEVEAWLENRRQADSNP